MTAERRDEALDLPLPVKERWQLLRAGIQNVWEYDDQRFVFHQGRLLLRGRNETGKTKALEVLLPFLLDADLSPGRLDPFGSRARQMRWNLLGDYNPGETLRVGYVWLELGRLDEAGPAFTTIGAGLRAQRSAPGVDSWYFVTSLRVDEGLRLLDERRAPLSRKALREALGAEGTVYEARRDYRLALCRRLFGLVEDQYGALVEALLQLRRPQLSKQLQPAELSTILTSSLPPLEPRVVAQLAEGFERLDAHRAEREELAAAAAAVSGFLRVYRRYLAGEARARARALTTAESAYQKARGEERERTAEFAAALALRDELGGQRDGLVREEAELVERIGGLRSSAAFEAVAQLDGAEALAEAREGLARDAGRTLEREGDRLRGAEARLATEETEARAAAASLSRERAAASELAAAAALAAEHRAADAAAEAGEVEAAAGTIASLVAVRLRAIEAVAAREREVGRARAGTIRAEDRLEAAREAEAEARSARDAAAEAEAGAEESLAEAFEAWADGLEVLRLGAEARAALADQPLEAAGSFARGLALEPAAELDEAVADGRLGLAEVEARARALATERDDLAAATHRPPEPPPWRSPRPEDRPGAPLYMLAEPRSLDEGTRGGLEAALEAAGLLDAWVSPEGGLLEPGTFDVLLAAAPRPGATLADALRPTPAGGIAPAVVEAILRSVGLVPAGAEPDDAAAPWVSPDGRFGLGPLAGRYVKPAAAFLGATARERERERRLAELEAELEEVELERAAAEDELARLRRRRARLDEELARLPDLGPLHEARARSAAAAEVLAARARGREEAEALAATARQELAGAEAARDGEAARAGLSAWVSALDALREATRDYQAGGARLLAEARALRGRLAERDRLAAEVDEARRTVAEAELRAAEGRGEAVRAQARAAALREALGATRDELLAAIRGAEGRLGEARRELEAVRRQAAEVERRVGASRGAVEVAAAAVAAREDERRRAEAELKALAGLGLLDLVLEDAPPDLPERSYTDALLAARRLDADTQEVDPSAAARERAENAAVARHQDLLRGVALDVRLMPRRELGLLVYDATWNGRRSSLRELAGDLGAEVEARDRLLDAEERELFESFLSGETHEHLRATLRGASRLVERMNGQLARRATAAGTQVRLRWAPSDEAPPGTAEAIALLLKSGALLTDGDRAALGRFLRGRLDEARRADGQGTLQERMLAVLDYRRWFVFTVETRGAAGGWRRLTRQVHSAGSGGQKAVLLHLPLFAAAAAFYESAGATSPRLVALDEAFAGIDRQTRGQLMGLLAEFDLDFIMTSYDEWGFYEELDGLATYHLSREPGRPGVHADRFFWDGTQALELGDG